MKKLEKKIDMELFEFLLLVVLCGVLLKHYGFLIHLSALINTFCVGMVFKSTFRCFTSERGTVIKEIAISHWAEINNIE